jgi:hypothetical protein
METPWWEGRFGGSIFEKPGQTDVTLGEGGG